MKEGQSISISNNKEKKAKKKYARDQREFVDFLHRNAIDAIKRLRIIYGDQLIQDLRPYNIESLQAFLLAVSEGFDIRKVDAFGWSVLHYAAYQGNLPLVEYIFKEYPELIQMTTGTEWSSDRRQNALHCAARNGKHEVVRFLLNKHVYDFNARDGSNKTALHLAASKGSRFCALFLIKNGADLKAKNNFGEMPLDVCNDSRFRIDMTNILRNPPSMEVLEAREYSS